MIYEFVGLPGSGKTYAAARVGKELSIPVICELSRMDRWKGAIAFCLQHPSVFLRLFYILLREEHLVPGLLWHKLVFLFLNVCAREAKASRMENVIVDEGIIQYIFSIYERKITAVDAERYITLLRALPNRLIVIFEASADLRIDRMHKRGRIPRSEFGLEYVEQREKIMEANYAIIAPKLKQKLGARIITSSNDFDILCDFFHKKSLMG